MISMRRAEAGDIDAVYRLSNDPTVRAMSFATEPIPYNDHVVWFEGKIHDSGTLLLVFCEDNELIAQMRFSDSGEGRAEVGIAVAQAWRHKGLGATLMGMALAELRTHGNYRTVIAKVKKGNEPSNRYFLKCGFSFIRTGVKNGVEYNEYGYQL